MEAELDIEGQKIKVQCEENESIESIYRKTLNKIQKEEENNIIFLYNGLAQKSGQKIKDIINIDDKKRKRLSILTTKNETEFIKPKHFLCPKCFGEAFLKLKDFKIYLKCENGHIINNLSIDEFMKSQEIDPSKILCDCCKKENLENCGKEKFKRCVECKKNFCDECTKLHRKEKNKKHCHHMIEYGIEKYKCYLHKDKLFNSYCENCHEDLCDVCRKSKKHKNHVIVHYNDILPDSNILLEKGEKFHLAQKDLIGQIDSIIKYFNFIKDYIESYSKFITYVLDNYNPMKINYQMINNIKSINFDETINDLNKINNGDNLINKFKDIMNLYHRMKYSNELTLIYKVNKNDKKIKIFGDEFVRNNKTKCKINIEGEESELKSEIYINKYFQKNKSEIMVELKNFDNIINMKDAFKDTPLISIPEISKVDMANIETMESTFQNCIYLDNLPELDWNIKKIKSMKSMFSGCRSIKYLSIKNWKTEKNQDMSYMFHDNRELKYIKGLKQLETPFVKSMECMFSGCCKLEEIEDISEWETTNLENIGEMFKGCKSLKSIPDISNWNTLKVKDIHELFYGCENLKSLPDISKWKTNNIESIYGLFNECSSLISIPDISKWKINKVNNLSELFADCTKLLEIPDISCWNVSNITDLSKLFFNCLSLKFLPNIGNWVVNNVINMNEVFSKCKNLDYLPDISSWDTSNVESMFGLFNECRELRYLPDISKWDIKKVTELDFMFNECNNLLSLPDIDGWELNEEVSIKSMFNKCFSLMSLPDLFQQDKSLTNYIENVFSPCHIPKRFSSNININSLDLLKSNSFGNKFPDLGINLISLENLEQRHKKFSYQTGMNFPSSFY